ncbi:hypothetical protein ABTH20_21915, partial [Acinetobacter baumannii]
LLFRIVHFFSTQNKLEIGNSFGITTPYMTTANEKANVVTLAADDRYVSLAKENCKSIQGSNIIFESGNIDQMLQPI